MFYQNLLNSTNASLCLLDNFLYLFLTNKHLNTNTFTKQTEK